MAHFSSFGVVLKKDELSHLKTHATDTFVDENLPVFHKAAAHGDILALNQLIRDDDSLLELRSPEGLTPLAQAVQCQQLDAMKLLIKLGADVNSQDNIGRTCLSVAAYQGWHIGVVCLLHNGARQDICDKSGRYPLHAATYHSDTNTLSLLLQNLTIDEINQPDHELMTAVHWAAFHDRPDHLMQLVQKGGDILAQDVDGKLPLHWAAQNGSFQCAHRLTSMTDGLASVNEVDRSKKSPAHYAAAAGCANILTILSHCDNINLEMEDPDERTPLHWAAAMSHPKAVETLLKLDVNPFPTDVDGYTPLDYAVQGENEACVKIMESVLGMKIDQLTKSRQNSVKGGKPEVNGPEIKYRYRKGTTPRPGDAFGPIPDIKVLPPTTSDKNTVPATTVVEIPEDGPERPRMYSASTDTDAYEFPRPHKKAALVGGNGGGGGGAHKTQNQTKPHIKEGESALISLISSSFMIGAQGPILNNDTTKREVLEDNRYSSGDDGDRWGHKTNSVLPSSDSRHGGDPHELKVMTSTNTPELNRVSVQSFRSIPPITDRSEAHPEHVSRVSGPSWKQTESSQLRVVKLPPLKSSSPAHFGNNMKPILPISNLPIKSHTQQAPPHDFMTENVSETRGLTRMWQKATKDFIHQHRSSHNKRGVLSLGATASKDVPVKSASTAATMMSGRSGKDSSVSTLIKYSRIPSTKMMHEQITVLNSKKTLDRVLRKTDQNVLAATPYSDAADESFPDKYPNDEYGSTPHSPTPLISLKLTSKAKGNLTSNWPPAQANHDRGGKSKSKVKPSGAHRSKRSLHKLSTRYANVQENVHLDAVDKKQMNMPSLYKEEKFRRNDGRRSKQERKLALAHQMAYS